MCAIFFSARKSIDLELYTKQVMDAMKTGSGESVVSTSLAAVSTTVFSFAIHHLFKKRSAAAFGTQMKHTFPPPPGMIFSLQCCTHTYYYEFALLHSSINDLSMNEKPNDIKLQKTAPECSILFVVFATSFY